MAVMEILMPFLHLLERYNGMVMTPAAAPEEMPVADPFADTFKSTLEVAPPPALTLVANR
jgi:hypothetical protein